MKNVPAELGYSSMRHSPVVWLLAFKPFALVGDRAARNSTRHRTLKLVLLARSPANSVARCPAVIASDCISFASHADCVAQVNANFFLKTPPPISCAYSALVLGSERAQTWATRSSPANKDISARA
jgi:hypothetical protein